MTPFYRAYRQSCRPPLVRIETLEIGELWYYDSPGVSVLACVGRRSLLVAYDSGNPREEVLDGFRSEHALLHGDTSGSPSGLYSVFAARQLCFGRTFVLHFAPGDWCGLPFVTPSQQDSRLPRGWE